MRMDFRSINYFVAVAQEMNMTKAAERLQMSQPPLSNQIKDLEEDLGVQLLIRSRKGVQLTPEGEVFYKRCLQMLELANHTRSEVKSLSSELSGTLRIGMVEGRAPFLLAKWMSGFTEEFPYVTYDLRNGSGSVMQDRLQHGLVDLAVIAAPFNGEQFDSLLLDSGPWLATMPDDHPLALKEGTTVTVKELSDYKLIVPQRPSRLEALHRWFQDAGCEADVICTLSSFIDSIALVNQGVGVSIFPLTTYAPYPGIVSKVIVDSPKRCDYVLLWRKGEALTPLQQTFVDYVSDFMEEYRDKVRTGENKQRHEEFRIPEGAELL